MSAAMLTAALTYAARGLAVFPVPPGTKQSYKSAKHSDGRKWGMTRDAEEIRRDFAQWPDAGIGIPTGAVNGIVVVETDTIAGGHAHDGDLAVAELEAKHGALPDTLQAISPSGSVHRYFRHPGADIKIKNSCSEIAPGIDVRGDGGMVLAPPTIRPGVGSYHWRNRNRIAPMPAWLIELTRDKPPTIRERAVAAIRRPTDCASPRACASEVGRYAQRALEYELAELVITPKGRRNAALNRASFSLHQLVAGGELDGGEVIQQLIQAATANGLVDDDGIRAVEATIESGMRAGLQHPRSRGMR